MYGLDAWGLGSKVPAMVEYNSDSNVLSSNQCGFERPLRI